MYSAHYFFVFHRHQLDPEAIFLIRKNYNQGNQTDAMLWVQGIALVLSVVIGMMTFAGSFVAVLKLHGTIASKPRIIPARSISNLIMVAGMFVFGALTFVEGWNDRTLGLTYLCLVGVFATAYGFFAVMAIGGGDMPGELVVCF